MALHRITQALLARFSASTFLDSARRHAATEFNAIGAMLEMLMRQPERPDDAATPLRLCYSGPSPPRGRHLEIERRLGLELVCGYDLSESPYGLIWRHGTRPYGTLGSVRQHPELGEVNHARVMEDGRRVPPGAVGELELRNPTLMLGYHRMPEETARVLVDGWLRTGDLVRENPDGTYTFVGRRKEVIRRRGENLAPVEVEAALESHPDIVEAAVVGVPSELSEEDVKAFVVLRDGVTLTPAEVHAFARGRLIAFKVPRFVELDRRAAAHSDGTRRQAPAARGTDGRRVGRRRGDGMTGADQGREDWLHTGIGSSTADRITVGGRDLAGELMGTVSFSELAFSLVARRPPTTGELRLFDAVLVSLTDHGLTPTVLAARLTHTGAPESLQGAVAAGLLGGGSVFLGPTEDTARFLSAALVAVQEPSPSDAALRAMAAAAVRERMAAGARVPGLGHPIHKVVDPRVPRLYAIAEEEGLLGPHLRLLGAVADAQAEIGVRRLPRSTAPGRRARPSPTSACRPRSPAASPSSPAPRGWSPTSPRRWSTPSARASTPRSSAAPATARSPTPRPAGESGRSRRFLRGVNTAPVASCSSRSGRSCVRRAATPPPLRRRRRIGFGRP